jgi:hypothetical protein
MAFPSPASVAATSFFIAFLTRTGLPPFFWIGAAAGSSDLRLGTHTGSQWAQHILEPIANEMFMCLMPPAPDILNTYFNPSTM